MATPTVLRAIRSENRENAVLLIHGFTGDAAKTWENFAGFLMECKELSGWDIFSIGYRTRLAPDFRGIWTGDPSIQTLATYLHTRVSQAELQPHKALVFIVHSMGGLVVQRALLDHPELSTRTSHVFLFGTPSNGLKKAGWFQWFKRQVKDMAADGPFVQKLRSDWKERWPKGKPPFRFWAVAGSTDEFVPVSSSLAPFPKEQQAVVDGNHLEIIKPKSSQDLPVRIVVEGIQGKAAPAGPWNAARVALQFLDFQRVVHTLSPHAEELDDAHLVQLALALEGLEQTDEALAVLERAGRRGTDARGVLAGRLKRRWIAEGREMDYGRAVELYESAYQQAVANNDHPQAYYHGINLCFLSSQRLSSAGNGKERDIAALAREVLVHCSQSPRDFWCLGTVGEANLVLGKQEEALAAYRSAVEFTPEPEPWQIQSMHSQASQLAAVLGYHTLLKTLDHIFRPKV
jgi:pimeloyl-ACP methyl ester carboxylesterase